MTVNECTIILALGTSLLCLLFYLLCYASVLIKFTYHTQNYAQEQELCLVYYHYLYTIFMNKSILIADNYERLFYYSVFINSSNVHCMFS